MTRLRPASVDDLLSLQDGVLSRAQALQTGLTDKYVVAALRSGRWQRLHTGVYAAFSGPPPRGAQLWAAVLRAGPEAVLSYQTAAELHGIGSQAAVIHVSVSPGRQVTSAHDNANTALGQGTLHYDWADVTGRPCFVASQVAGALAARGWTGAPRRCGHCCGLPGTGRGGT